MNKWDLLKLKSFLTEKEAINKTKRQSTDLEKIFANDVTEKGFSSVQSLSHVRLFATPCTPDFPVHHQSRSLPKLTSVELVMPSNHLILWRPLLSPSIFPSIRVSSNELVLRIRWPKYWSFSISISPSNEYSGLIFFRID